MSERSSGVRLFLEGVPWESPAPGVRFKAAVRSGQRLRLLEFSDGFVEPDWCTRGHAFRVLEGSFTLETVGSRERFSAGDVGIIEEGERHKASVGQGERALLFLVERG